MPKGVKRKATNDGEPVSNKGKAAMKKTTHVSKPELKINLKSTPTRTLRSASFYGKSSQEVKEESEPQCDGNFNTAPVDGTCWVERLSDEILVKIFCLTDSMTKLKTIRSVCKRWNSLVRDKYLWREVDFTSIPLQPKQLTSIVRYCCSEVTESLGIRAPTKYTGEDARRKKLRASKCLTKSILANIRKRCTSLKSLTITHEQFGRQLTEGVLPGGIYSLLPINLTHLSLAHCNLQGRQLDQLFESEFPLLQIKSLDLTGVMVNNYDAYSFKLVIKVPPALESLILRDIHVSLNAPIFLGIEEHAPLVDLDISVTQIGIDRLQRMSRALINLKSLNMCGCLVAEDDESALGADFDDDIPESEWFEVFQNGFPSLGRLNIRNVQMCSGEKVYPLMEVIRDSVIHLVDVDGKTRGEWNEEQLKTSYVETEKYDYYKRRDSELQARYRARRGLFGGRRIFRGFLDPYDSDDDDLYEDSDDEDWERPFFGGEREQCSIM